MSGSPASRHGGRRPRLRDRQHRNHLHGRGVAFAACVLVCLQQPAAAADPQEHPAAADPQEPTTAQSATPRDARSDRLVIDREGGRARTRASTVEGLLPRPLPTGLSDDELVELDRRLRNLEIFDDVAVQRANEVLSVRLREKFTLRPEIALSTGRSLRDSYLLLGLTEFNVAGTATAVSAWGSWEQRGPSGGVSVTQHPYGPRRWALSGELSYSMMDVRFDEDASIGWEQHWLDAWIGFAPPLPYDRNLRVVFGPFVSPNRVSNVRGTLAGPEAGLWTGAFVETTWDRYVWDDLVPRGTRLSVNAASGWLAGQERGVLVPQLTAEGALPLGSHVALVGRGRLEGYLSGTASWAPVLGSQTGVRGLPESLYRNRVHTFANVELRASARVLPRLALQAVAFADVASFRRIRPDGSHGDAGWAMAVGAGPRLVPTFLAGLLLRVDVSRVIEPAPSWFVQLGFDQYF